MSSFTITQKLSNHPTRFKPNLPCWPQYRSPPATDSSSDEEEEEEYDEPAPGIPNIQPPPGLPDPAPPGPLETSQEILYLNISISSTDEDHDQEETEDTSEEDEAYHQHVLVQPKAKSKSYLKRGDIVILQNSNSRWEKVRLLRHTPRYKRSSYY